MDNTSDFIGFLIAFVLFVAASNGWYYLKQWRKRNKNKKPDAKN